MKKALTANEVALILRNEGFNPSSLSKNKAGNFVYRKEFYYTMGQSAIKISQQLKAVFPEIEIVETNDIWKPFKGQANVANSSHFRVEFKMLRNNTLSLYQQKETNYEQSI